MNNAFENFKKIKSQLQGKLDSLRTEGSSGGDLVKVTVDGNMEAVSVSIDPIAVDPRDVKMLEELIAAAYTDAVRKMKMLASDEMSLLTGEMGLFDNSSDDE